MESRSRIVELGGEANLAESVSVIRVAFGTVAAELGLTEARAPTHPAFMTLERLTAAKRTGIRMFALLDAGAQIGFVSLEEAPDGVFYLERLAVLPAQRHRGHGRALMDHSFEVVRSRGGRAVSIALIDEHQVLKDWYRAYGFAETGRKSFPHLPFTVCFMEKRVTG